MIEAVCDLRWRSLRSGPARIHSDRPGCLIHPAELRARVVRRVTPISSAPPGIWRRPRSPRVSSLVTRMARASRRPGRMRDSPGHSGPTRYRDPRPATRDPRPATRDPRPATRDDIVAAEAPSSLLRGLIGRPASKSPSREASGHYRSRNGSLQRVSSLDGDIARRWSAVRAEAFGEPDRNKISPSWGTKVLPVTGLSRTSGSCTSPGRKRRDLDNLQCAPRSLGLTSAVTN